LQEARIGMCFHLNDDFFFLSAINDIRSKLKIFSYADMKTATGDFDRENKLGEGGYGAVYKVC
jgi:hypothetical protein